MININTIDHLNLKVSNLDNSVNFYQKIFGFKVYEEGFSSDKPYKIIGLKDKLFLCLYEQRKSSDKGPLNHIGINVVDFDHTYRTLTQEKIPLHYGGVVDYPKSRSLYIEDPDGNAIELSEFFGGALAG